MGTELVPLNLNAEWLICPSQILLPERRPGPWDSASRASVTLSLDQRRLRTRLASLLPSRLCLPTIPASFVAVRVLMVSG